MSVALIVGCAPALDWRELRPPDSGVAVLLPCKPDRHARRVSLAGSQVQLVLYACSAAGVTWALAWADLGDPARVSTALVELRTAAASNLGASDARELQLQVRATTPNDNSRRVELRGRLPDGRTVVEQVAVFAYGTRVFQATVLGETLDTTATDAFFAGLRVLP